MAFLRAQQKGASGWLLNSLEILKEKLRLKCCEMVVTSLRGRVATFMRHRD